MANDSPVEIEDIISFVDRIYSGDEEGIHDEIHEFGKKFDYAKTFLPVLKFMNSLKL